MRLQRGRTGQLQQACNQRDTVEPAVRRGPNRIGYLDCRAIQESRALQRAHQVLLATAGTNAKYTA